MQKAYTFLLYLMLPFVAFRLIWRTRKMSTRRRRTGERFGSFVAPQKTGGFWVHAVSMGEVQAIAPLIKKFLQDQPEIPVCITTTTQTGSDQVIKLFGDEVFHVFLPYDLPPLLAGFFNKVKPEYLLMVETEVWPNLLSMCQQRGVKTLLANARMSERSKKGYLRVKKFAQQVFQKIDQVAAQDEQDANRFIELGARSEAMNITGSIKFDISIAASVEESVEVMRRTWQGRPVWVAASTHEGEEEVMLKAHAVILREHPSSILVLVPRHPERFERVALQVVRSGLSMAKRSNKEPIEGHTQVYLADSMGELAVLLGSSDAAFIGGSLTRVGGHNMLEASAQGVPVCFGPHTFNFTFISSMLLKSGAAVRINDEQDLAQVISQWLSDASVRTSLGEAGRQMVARNKGALKRLQTQLSQMMVGDA